MRKLKNERGESILMALLLLLLASVISALILTAATSAAHHLRNDRKAQQNYLTVSSAAELIRDSVLNDSYKRVFTRTTTKGKDDEELKTETRVSTSDCTGLLKQWLKNSIDDLDENAEYAKVNADKDTIKVNVTTNGTEDSIQTVQAEFMMDGDANITVKLSLLQSDEQDTAADETNSNDTADNCLMTLKINGNVKKEGGTVTDDEMVKVEEYTTTINWDAAKITKGIKEADSEKAEG